MQSDEVLIMAWVQWTLEDLKKIADAEEQNLKLKQNPDSEDEILMQAFMEERKAMSPGGGKDGSSDDGSDRPVYS